MAHLSPEEFGAAFDLMFRRSAFRLEMLDHYEAENELEPFRRFLAGRPQDPAWREPWKKFVRAAVRDGKRMARVHVVDEPLSDYLQFELTCAYPANVEAGEDVRILQREAWPHLLLPSRDYWLFDNSEVVLMHYDRDGNFLCADPTSDPEIVHRYILVRDELLKHSVPLTHYLASLGIKEAV